MPIYWDSYVAARLIDENEPSAGLKQQYIDKIDPTQEKYDIEGLFEELPYAIFDPDLFAYYASTDAYMTYKLYKWQLERFKDPDLKGSFWIFNNIEMPLITIVAKMELTGIPIDREYIARLSSKYHNLMDDCNLRVNEELGKYKDKILEWRLTPKANEKPTLGRSKTIKGVKYGFISGSDGPGDNSYWYEEKTGRQLSLGEVQALGLKTTIGKSKNEQLEDPIKISSPTQLAILLYDVLKMPQVSTKQPRGTGVDELTALYRKTNSKLCSLILEMRGLDKLLNTFIDKLPNDANPKDDKIHCEFLPLGTDSGRFSSARPNLQQIPRANIEIKPMFRAPISSNYIIEATNYIELGPQEEINVKNIGWKKIKDLKIEDFILDEDNNEYKILKKENLPNKIKVYF